MKQRFRFGAGFVFAGLLVGTVLAGCSAPALVSTSSTTSTTLPHSATTAGTTTTPSPTTAAPPTPTTTPPPATTAPTTVPVSSSSVGTHWGDLAFAIPKGWVLSAPIHGKPQDACVHPATAPASTPSWEGCPGIWVTPWTTDPTQPAPGSVTPGGVWFMSNSVVACPFGSTNPDDVVLTPGTLTNHGTRTLGGMTYQWYEWSATCNLSRTAGAPVTHTFDAQVWWLPSVGMAFSDVADHPEITGMLDSARVDVPPPTTTTAPTTTTTNPTGNLAFESPTGNIQCQITTGATPTAGDVHCSTTVPPEGVTLLPNGAAKTCSGPTCIGAPGAVGVLPYGEAVGRGPFSCTSTSAAMICTVGGKGFSISRSGIGPA